MRGLLLISGKMGSGKTSVADAVEDILDSDGDALTQRVKFAGPLYAMQEMIYSYLERYGVAPVGKDRVLLQVLGTEWGRNSKGEDFWVNILRARANAFEGTTIVDDCRFPNELLTAYGLPTLRVRLVADDAVRAARLSKGGTFTNLEHPSETALDGHAEHFDLTVSTNNRSAREVAEIVLVEARALFSPPVADIPKSAMGGCV